jgi:ABC-type amino acid transport substrate-binding protein
MTPTKERAERALFSKPYLTGDPLVIISASGAPLKTIDELKDKNVAVNEGYTADYYLSKIQGPQLIRFASPIESFMALESGRVDALVMARTSVSSFLNHYGADKFSVSEIPNTNEENALAISKKYADLEDPIQKALDSIQADGTLEKLKEKWKLTN